MPLQLHFFRLNLQIFAFGQIQILQQLLGRKELLLSLLYSLAHNFGFRQHCLCLDQLEGLPFLANRLELLPTPDIAVRFCCFRPGVSSIFIGFIYNLFEAVLVISSGLG